MVTSHGIIDTPSFIPCATQASVKSLAPEDLREIGVQIVLGNTYHLHLRPGEAIIKGFGGLGKFMGWMGPTITDSGGFQVFSLGKKFLAVDGKEVRLVKISDEKVEFRSHIDGSLRVFTPEASIEIQQKLGADIILPLDHCPAYPSTYDQTKKSVERTHEWALRSLGFFQKKKKNQQALYGIVQGGVYRDLREESAKFISRLNFDGIAIGGVAVGEGKQDMINAVDWTTQFLPEDKPRHLLGVGEVDDIFNIVSLGIDTFDCVMPTRMGRMGFVFVHPPEGNPGNRFRIDITKKRFAKDKNRIDGNCACYACLNFTRGYVHHLFRSRELLAYRLASYHNVYFLNHLVREIRESIIRGRLDGVKRRFGARDLSMLY